MRHIVILAIPPALELDVIGPMTVFSFAAKSESASAAYRITLASSSRNRIIEGSCGGRMLADCHYTKVQQPVDTLLVAGGPGAQSFLDDKRLCAWLNHMSTRVRRIGSICTGAFVLAPAGLLDRKQVATHWRFANDLAERYPQIDVNPKPIWIRDGKVYTSAGVTAGIDLALALVEEDLGGALALTIARYLVVFLRRPGGQSQFSVALEAQAPPPQPLLALQSWIADHLASDLTVSRLAEKVAMSQRNFARVFTSKFGTTPALYVRRARVEAARRLLEQSGRGLEEIAGACGFGGAEVMRRAFTEEIGVSPRLYREQFSR
ncbi:GlxA family transcriptional regulator [Paludibaculum fermentans]|uniref:GlxA family transcriptional regulator n=1 Tax=Paludibaculum fermentans TaxID=1473598 RepID=UPI003EB77B86